MTYIDLNINRILTDNTQLALDIEKDPNFKLNSDRDVNLKEEDDIEELVALDSELTSRLAKYHSYRVISDLLKEFNMNFEYLELENCYYSLQNVHKKLMDVNFSSEGILFQQSVSAYIDNLHLKLVTKLKELFDCFWDVTEHSLRFSNTLNVDAVMIDYESLLRICEETLFSSEHLDQTSWFISNISIQSYKEEVTEMLQHIYTSDIKLLPVFDFFRSFAFEDRITLSDDSGTLKIKKISQFVTAEEKLRDYCTLLTYISNNFSTKIKESVLHELGDTIISEISKLIRRNAGLLSEDEKESREILYKINDLLKTLDQDVCWDYNSDELDRFLNDDNICVILNFESMAQQRIIDMRRIFSSDWSKIHKVPVKSFSNRNESADQNTVNKNIQDEDEWIWKEEEEEEEEDGWTDDLDLDEYTISVEVSDFALKGLQIFEKYEQSCEEFQTNEILALRDYKCNLLQASFFSMATAKVENWTRLFRDVKYMCSINLNLSQLKELNERFLENRVLRIKKTIHGFLKDQLQEIKDNESSPSWDITLTSMLPYIKEHAIPSLLELEDNTVVLDLLGFIINETLLGYILSWQIISERASESLSELISLLLPVLDIPRLNMDDSYRHMREKLRIVRSLLSSHLKDILKMFYDGDFFMFNTNEIIKWIILLFADTQARKDCIEEIENVRKEAEI